jgi:hypothetical protein
MGNDVASKRSDTPSPESVARANRQRLAVEEGRKAMADVEQRATAVRANMARLRALREVNEAKAREIEKTAPAPKKTKKKRTAKVD